MRKTESLIRLPKELKEYLAKSSKDAGLSQSQFVEQLLIAYQEKQEQKNV